MVTRLTAGAIIFVFSYVMRGHTCQLIVHKFHWTRYSFLFRMLFDNIKVQAELYRPILFSC